MYALREIHITTKDKIDLCVSTVSIADCIWIVSEMTFNTVHPYHFVVAPLLFIGTLISLRLLYKLMVRHHTSWVKRQARKIEAYKPYVKQSDK